MIAEVIGSAATATVLRRSAQRAAAAGANVEGVRFERKSFEYHYVLPEEWSTPSPDAMKALRALVRELDVLLRELTGAVLVRRLHANPELRNAELFGTIEAP
jgi:predicted nucleic acid-binding Zn ribbon protein